MEWSVEPNWFRLSVPGYSPSLSAMDWHAAHEALGDAVPWEAVPTGLHGAVLGKHQEIIGRVGECPGLARITFCPGVAYVNPRLG